MSVNRFGSKFRKFLKKYKLPETLVQDETLSEFFLRIHETEENEKEQKKSEYWEEYGFHVGSSDEQDCYGALGHLRVVTGVDND